MALRDMAAHDAARTDQWEEVFDFVIVGSGGGSMIAAIAVADAGKSAIILEKTDKVGGSTAMSGGVFWIPNNPLMAREGIEDSPALARRYMDAAVGEVGPSTSDVRKTMFLAAGPQMVEYLEAKGMPFVRCDGWSDYHDELPGGCAASRSLAVEPFDVNRLGPAWRGRLRRGISKLAIRGFEARYLSLMKRSFAGKRAAFAVGMRLIKGRLLGRDYVGTGAAIQGRMLEMALRHHVDIRTDCAVLDLVEENGRITGVVIEREGRSVRIGGRAGVLINAGGFSHNAEMREKYGPHPASAAWTSANSGDTGEAIRMAEAHGARLDLTDQAAWVLTSLPPGGRFIHVLDLPKPHCILVDQQGRRFTNEAQSYMANGQAVYARGDVPVYAIIESRHRHRYPWGFHPGPAPRSWFDSGYMKKADTIEGLAVQIGVPPENLRATIDRFNGFAREGKDRDFARGERAYDRVYADPGHRPHPGLGTVEQPPFYAVAIYPGDVGTVGGIVADEYGRVVRGDGSVISGLYASGNSTASVMGKAYPGAGATISNSFVFGWVAARHAMGEFGTP